MKRAIFASILLLIVVAAALAQGGGKRGANYDPKTVESFTGQIVSVEEFTRRNGNKITNLIVKTDKETLPIQLCPTRFLDSQEIKFAAQDKIEVKGSRVNVQDKTTIVASEVRKDGKTLKLRDENGQPIWRNKKEKD